VADAIKRKREHAVKFNVFHMIYAQARSGIIHKQGSGPFEKKLNRLITKRYKQGFSAIKSIACVETPRNQEFDGFSHFEETTITPRGLSAPYRLESTHSFTQVQFHLEMLRIKGTSKFLQFLNSWTQQYESYRVKQLFKRWKKINRRAQTVFDDEPLECEAALDDSDFVNDDSDSGVDKRLSNIGDASFYS